MPCPCCLIGNLVPPQAAVNCPDQPDLMCTACGKYYWYLR